LTGEEIKISEITYFLASIEDAGENSKDFIYSLNGGELRCAVIYPF
jgi:hypothetical protein